MDILEFGKSYNGLNYWLSYVDNNDYIYSCDMIRISFIKNKNDDIQNYFQNYYLRNSNDIEIYGPILADTRYRWLITIKYGVGASVSIGIGFNGFTSEDSQKCFIEFNPNKLYSFPLFWSDLKKVLCDFSWSYEIKRFDFAVDLPETRSCFVLSKDERKYRLDLKSLEDKTEYLGCRNNNGFLKLYNKKIESKLDNDLTRLEITFDFNNKWENFRKNFPDLYVRPSQKFENPYDIEKLSNTQLVLARCISDSDNPEYYLKMLEDRRIQKKIKDYIYSNAKKVEIDKNGFSLVYDTLKALFDDLHKENLLSYSVG